MSVLDGPLPVAWDGRRVEWRDWHPMGPTFICDRSKRKNGLTIPECSCGSVRFHSAAGIVEPAPGATEEGEYLRLGPAGRPVYAVEPAKPMMELTITRCASCGRDQVYEWPTETLWDLGPEDYGPAGSVAP